MVEHILVPVDGSEGSEAAIQHAVDLAESLGSTIHLVHVVDTDRIESLPGIEIYELDLMDASEGIVDEASTLPAEHGITVVKQTIPGTPHNQITKYAEDNDIDLIVIGTVGKSRVERWLIGSVTERVVRKSPVPVLTVRA